MAAASIALLALASPGHAQATFTGLGDLPGGPFESGATDVSADGSVVVGWGTIGSTLADRRAFRWTAADGMIALDPVGGVATGVSRGGEVIAGYYGGGAFRWSGQWMNLGDLPGGLDFGAIAFDVSADGRVVVGGSASDSGAEAFRWTASGGMVGLGHLPGGPAPGEETSSIAYGSSPDGTIIVGESSLPTGRAAFRWSETEGMKALGTEEGQSRARSISADGSTIVGVWRKLIDCGWREVPVRWSADGTMTDLTDLPSDACSETGEAFAVSADGSVVVGQTGAGAFVWDEIHGLRLVADVLEDVYGLDLTGWQLTGATGVSDDGRTIVGPAWGPHGVNPEGMEAWVAVLEPPPPPQCSDGVDNDGDGLVDFPDDPGCVIAGATRENPACDDGLDNDGDGLVDFDDPTCEPQWPYWEQAPCGLGAELVAPIALALGAHGRRRRRRG